MVEAVLCFQVFPHLADHPAALREIARVLLPGGRLWIDHLMSRCEVNELHAGLGPAVEDHRIPPDSELRSLLKGAGLQALQLGDTPTGYLVEARKPHTA